MAYIGKSPSQAVRNRYYYTQSGNGATSLSGSDDASNTLTFADGNYVDVLLNGVTLVAGTDYNTSTANTIAGLSALSSGDVVQVIVYDTFSVFSGNVNGDFTVGGDIVVSGTVDSRDVNADGTKLDGIEASATADQTASEIRTLVESASDSNVFTDADHSKLNAIEASADVTDSTNVASAGAAMLSGATFTGSVGIGTSPSTLLHLNSSSDPVIRLQRGGGAYSQIVSDSGGSLFLQADNGASGSSSRMQFNVDGAEKMRLTNGGRLGISTSSPSATLDVAGDAQIGTSTGGIIYLQGGSSTSSQIRFFDGGNGRARIGVPTGQTYLSLSGSDSLTPDVAITSAGNVGIGTASPSGARLHVVSSDLTSAKFETSNGNSITLGYDNLSASRTGDFFIDNRSASGNNIQYRSGSSAAHIFNNGTSEKMRLSGTNLSVGTTTTDIYDSTSETGSVISDGYLAVARASSVAYFNRLSSDGRIVDFRKSGSVIGEIRTYGDDLAIGTGDTGLRFIDGSNAIAPSNIGSNTDVDNTIDLGYSSRRFKDIYLSGGINFSANANASGMTSELLDDYEEGTWLPFLGSNETITSRYGRYVKIGNICHVQFRLVINQINNGSQFAIFGLPFTSANLGHHQTGSVGYNSNILTSNYFSGFYMNGNGSTINFIGKSVQSHHVHNNMPTFQAGTDIAGAISYFVS